MPKFFVHVVTKKFLVDTCIWIDLYENRRGLNNEPFGDYAWQLISKIIATNSIILITDVTIQELERHHSLEQINGLFLPIEKIMEKYFVTREQFEEAKVIATERNLPIGDVLHSIIARDTNSILVTRDNHFKLTQDIARSFKPEDIS